MEPDRQPDTVQLLPDTRQEMVDWVRDTMPLTEPLQELLLTAIDRVLTRQEQRWQSSKQDAMRALSQGFANQLSQLKMQLAAKDATVANISEYFETLVSNLNEKAGRDPKTNLLNFPRFQEALSILLATERRGHRCAIGLIDIARFKWYNDTCGHLVGDQIIEKVSTLLRQHMRDRDLVAKEPDAAPHAARALRRRRVLLSALGRRQRRAGEHDLPALQRCGPQLRLAHRRPAAGGASRARRHRGHLPAARPAG